MTKIIADACANHLGNRNLMETMIQKASEAKVDIIKFQAFQADKLNPNFPDYKTNYEYYKMVELEPYDYNYIIDKCKSYGIEPLFTIFHKTFVPFLKELGQHTVKIASPDSDNYDLIEACIKEFPTVLVSTGMSDHINIKKLRQYPVKTLYCVSKYPTNPEDINYDQMIYHDGFSDHTLTTDASKKAIDLGLDYIEKHFTLGRDLYGRDQAMSSTIDQFRELVQYRDYKSKIQIYKDRWI